MAQSVRRPESGAARGTPSGTPRRADAQRSINSILDAALVCFNQGPDATMTEIAQAAGVGRVTLYGHFKSREEVLGTLLARSLDEADKQFAELDLDSGPAREATSRLMHAPWLLGRYRGLYAAATKHLGAEQVRRLHDTVFSRVRQLIGRGQDEGAFRTDLPLDWLVTCVYALAHAAVTEADSGQTGRDRIADLLTESVLGLLDAR